MVPRPRIVSPVSNPGSPSRTTKQTESEVKKLDKQLSKQRSNEVKSATKGKGSQWSSYPQEELPSPMGIEQK